MQFCAGALRSGRYMLTDLYNCLHTTDKWGPKVRVKLNAPALRTLARYWKAPPEEDQGRPWGPFEKVRVL